jgi:hypothetical protein
MRIGEVFRWSTNQAIGHTDRLKMHVYICSPTWQADGHSFLFISSSNYGSDYRIENPPYGFLTLKHSFVSCGSIVTYPAEYMASRKVEFLGRLTEAHLNELEKSIADTDYMENWQVKLCCNSIRNSDY